MAEKTLNPTSEAPEVRDSDEILEDQTRTPRAGVPYGIDGRPMCRIAACVSDKVPTVQFGNVVVGPVTIERYVDDLGDGHDGRQHRIDRARELQRDAEFVLGIERRLLQWALDPASKVSSPVTGGDAFAAPPAGYDPTAAADPRVMADQQAALAAAAAAPQAAQAMAAVAVPPPGAPQVG